MIDIKKWKICGVIPAAGLANRLAPLPFSKELFLIDYGRVDDDHLFHPKTSMQFLLESMKEGGAENVFIVIRNPKWDIPAYYGDGSQLGLNLAYLMMGIPYGHPFTINQAFNFTKEQIVLVGFPDILVAPSGSFKELVDKLISSDADAFIGLYAVDNPKEWDMVKTTSDGDVLNIAIKNYQNSYNYAWSTIAWKPRFSEFLNNYLQEFLCANPNGKISIGQFWREIILSDIINAAIKSGLKIKGHQFSGGKCLDIGTLEGLKKADTILNFLKDENKTK